MSNATNAVADRRTTNVRFRQHQLLSLRKWIDEHISDLEDALRADEGLSKSEAQLIIAMSLDEVRRNYDSLDLKEELDIEYRVKKSHDSKERKLAEELVYVIPDRYTLLYGVASSLCACIAAGSCCTLEVRALLLMSSMFRFPDTNQLPTDLLRLSSLLRMMVTESLDTISFRIASTRPSIDQLRKCLVIDQQDCVSPGNARRLLASYRTSGAVAIVDRTANVDLAAKHIAMSISLYSSRGPYAPTCIFVNEFVQKEFSRRLEKHVATISGQISDHSTADGVTNSRQPKPQSLRESRMGPGTGFYARTADRYSYPVDRFFGIVDHDNRDKLRLEKSEENRWPELVHVSSLDDAIDLIDSYTSRSLLAVYIFADPSPAKYLGQFIKADSNFINHIPANLLGELHSADR